MLQEIDDKKTSSEIFHRESQNGRKRIERETVLPTMTEDNAHFIPAAYDDGQELLWVGIDDAELNDSCDSHLGQQFSVTSVLSNLPTVQEVSESLNIISKFIKTPTKRRQRLPGYNDPSYKYRDLDYLDKDE